MDEFGLVWLSLVWFDEVDFLKCSRSASQLSFTNLLNMQAGSVDWTEAALNVEKMICICVQTFISYRIQ